MATAVLQGAKVNVSKPYPVTPHPRRPDPPEASSSRYPQPTTVLDVFGSPPSAPEPPSRTFHRFRSSLEQSLRTATRSKKPPALVDEFATITGKAKKGKEKEIQDPEDGPPKEKDRLKMFRKVTFRKAGRDSPTRALNEGPHQDQDRMMGRTSFLTPSMRQASMSSPALHLSSQALPSPKSQSAVVASSSSNADVLVSPTRQRTRRVSLQPTPRETGGPAPSSGKLEPKGDGQNGTTRHRSTKSTPPAIPASPSSPSLPISTPSSRCSSSPVRVRSIPSSPPESPTPPSGSRVAPRTPSKTSSSVNPRTASPTQARSPSNRIRVITPSRGMISASASHLPLSSSPSPTTRRPSIDSPYRQSPESPRRSSGDVTVRRPSIDTPQRSRDSPIPLRAESPPSPVRARSRTPSQRAYAQNRHFNISAGSLLLPASNPEHRELIRTATSMVCKEILKPPLHMTKTDAGLRDWEEVEYRTRALVRLERIWGRSGGPTTNPSAGSPISSSSAGEERERRLFCDALRDGFVLCQLLNKLRSSSVVRPDPREDGFVKTSNVTKFLAACASYGLANEDLFHRDDLIEGTSESLARVAQTIIALVKFVESPAPSRSKVMSGIGKSNIPAPRSPYGTLSKSSTSTPNLLSSSPSSPASPTRRKWDEPKDLPTLRSYSPGGLHNESSTTIKAVKETGSGRAELRGDDLEFKPISVPYIKKPSPPPKSPLRRQASKQDVGGLVTWAKYAASPPRAFSVNSTQTTFTDMPANDSSPTTRQAARQSVASSVLTSTTMSTTPSSLLDNGYSNSANKYGTIRTVTTEMTSEAPSISRTEGSSIAEGLARKASAEIPKYRDRRSSEAHNVDLSRVAEETEESISRGSKDLKQVARNRIPDQRIIEKPAVHLRKGKWPDDFLDAFQMNNSPRSLTPISTTSGPEESFSRSSPILIPSPKKLAVIGRPNEEQGSQFPRRPTHRPRHSVDTPGLLSKDSLLCRDASPDSSTSASSRAMLRRHSTKPLHTSRTGSYVPRGSDEVRGSEDPLVPFPRTVSGDRANGAPSPTSGSSTGETAIPEERPRLRGRFQSDVDSSTRRRARPSSYDELGVKPARTRFESMVDMGASGTTSASDLLARDSLDGSVVRMALVVKEDGRPPTHFKLGNCIGRGQFGSVYRALNLSTGQMVAVKRIRLEGLKEEEVTQLMREVDLVKSLSHPSIVKYEGMARDEDTLSIVLEYAENGSLGQTLKAFGKLNERLVASYVVKILEGLHYLHGSDVVHCDLKAANILTTKNGNVKLSDFGVSLNLRAMEREIKDVAGTPNWMAPEVIELKGASTKSDIWSLGCTVVELLTGRPPYAEIANSMSVMFRIVEDDMPALPEACSDLLQDFLKQCFQKDPTNRPSAEMLCEHPWLQENWGALNNLRPQDSIPFLRRVSTDFQKIDGVRHLSQMDMSESPVSEGFVRGDAGKVAPLGRRPSNLSVRPPDNDISPREHSFVKTTFSKPMMCRVCLLNVKKSAVLCAQCSLIAHAKCATHAPPTCDLRAQLLLYAQYAEKGNPASIYSNPADLLGDSKSPVAMSDVPYVSHSASGRTEADTPPPRSPLHAVTSESSPTAFRFMAAFKRSRTSLTPEPITKSVSSTPLPLDTDEPTARRRPTLLQKRLDRPQSIVSDSTGASSLRSAATAAESFSSRYQSQSSSGGRATKASRFSGNATLSVTNESDANRSDSQLLSEPSTSDAGNDQRGRNNHNAAKVLGALSPEPRTGKHQRGSKSSGNCVIQ